MSKQYLTWSSPDPNRSYALKATGFSEKYSFKRADSADEASFLLALTTGLSGLPAYNGRTITVTGAYNTGVTVDFSGSTEPAILMSENALVDLFTVVGGNGAVYSLGGKTPFTLPITEAALQTNQGAGVVVKGTSAASTAAGQVDNFSGSGPAVSLNGVAVDFTAADPKAKLQADYRASAAGRAGVLVGGTFSKAARIETTGLPANASSEYPGYPASNAFDNDVSTKWSSSQGPSYPHFVQVDLGVATTFGSYSLTYDNNQMPGAWTLQGSNTGSFSGEQTVVDTRNGQTPVAASTVTYNFAKATFRYLRWVFTQPSTAAQSISLEDIALFSPAAIQTGTFTYPASVGPQGAIAVVGTGYTGNTTAPGAPNGSANFKLFYPVGATPPVPPATGPGASTSRFLDGTQSVLLVTQPSAIRFAYVIAPGSHAPVQAPAQTFEGASFVLQIADVDKSGLGNTPASFKSKIEHSDDGVSYTDLVVFDALTDKGCSLKTVPAGTGVKPYVRFNRTEVVGRWAPSVAMSRRPV